MGLVPYDVIARMTTEEWQRIQNVERVSSTEILTLPRTKTPEMDRERLSQLVIESKE